jgi:hypothetical protein
MAPEPPRPPHDPELRGHHPRAFAEEYQSALARLATKYRLSPNPPGPENTGDAPEPDQLLDHLAQWVRKHAPASGALRDLLRRIARLRQEVQNLTPPTKK